MRRVLGVVLLLPFVALAALAALAGDWPVALGTAALVAVVVAGVRVSRLVGRWAGDGPGRGTVLLGLACLVLGSYGVWQLATGYRPEGRYVTAWVTIPLCLLLAPFMLWIGTQERRRGRRSRRTG